MEQKKAVKQKNQRIEDINKLILEIASGNFSAKGTISQKQDEIDAITVGINMLAEELKESTVSRDYFNRIYSSIVDMVFILNKEGKIDSINDEVSKCLGYTEEDLKNVDFYKLFSPARKIKSVYKLILKEKSLLSLEKKIRKKDHNILPVSISGSALQDNQKRHQGMLFIVRDISKLKKYEQDLLNKNKEMDQFVYKASHDIKGPLISIVGLTNIAIKEVSDPMSMEYFNLINKTASRLSETLVALLNIAVTEKARKEVSEVNLFKLIHETIESLTTKENAEQVKITVSIDPDFIFKTNQFLLTSVIQNLIQNGIKYRNTKVASVLNIQAAILQKHVEITIEDNGIGIEKSIQSKIFDMFFRGTEQSEGSGLGLYIVKSNVEKMGGSLSFSSKPGTGTTFKIEIPHLR